MPYNANYTPVDAVVFATPVTVGNVAGLFGVETPGGKGVLFWCTARYQADYPLGGQSMYYAVVDSPADFLTDGVVSSPDQMHLIDIDGNVDDYGGTSVDTGNLVAHPAGMIENNHVGRPSVSLIDGKIVLAISFYAWGDIETRVFICESPDVFPLTFTRVGDIQAGTAADSGFILPYPASGTFYEVSPTRWVYSGGWKTNDAGVAKGRFGVWYTDNGAASWTNGVATTFVGPFGTTNHGYQAPQIEFDPISASFFFTQQGVAGTHTMFDVWSSSDAASWSKIHSFSAGSGGGAAGHGFVNDGSNAFLVSYESVRRLTVLSTWTAEDVAVPGTGAGLPELQMARRVLVTGNGHAYYFHGDNNVSSIASTSGGWIVGSVGFGERLIEG